MSSTASGNEPGWSLDWSTPTVTRYRRQVSDRILAEVLLTNFREDGSPISIHWLVTDSATGEMLDRGVLDADDTPLRSAQRTADAAAMRRIG